MKNKIFYLAILIFSASLLASAKKIRTCNKTSTCAELIRKERKASIKTETGKEPAAEIPSLGLFFFNI